MLWDEAQDHPALLRFLSPFGRPDLGRLTRRFRSAGDVNELIGEGYPEFASWLATMVLRDGLHAEQALEALVEPIRESSMLTPPLRIAAGLQLGSSRLRTVVVAGSLKTPIVRVRGARLVVAGDLETQLLIADGCVLVGGSVIAGIVACPATQLVKRARGPAELAQPLGWQVGREVRCRVFDSPRFGLSCPVKAEVVLRGVGVPLTPEADERLRERLVPRALRGGTLDLAAITELILKGQRVFNG